MYDMLTHGQAQPDPLSISILLLDLKTTEFEELIEILFPNTHTTVFDRHAEPLLIGNFLWLSRLERIVYTLANVRLDERVDDDVALQRELDRVLNQDEKSLLDAFFILNDQVVIAEVVDMTYQLNSLALCFVHLHV